MIEANSKKELLTILDRLIAEAIVAHRIQYRTSELPDHLEKILYMGNTKYTVNCFVDCLDRMRRRVKLNSYKPKLKSGVALKKIVEGK